MRKKLNVKGKIYDMTFEETYKQFEGLRYRMFSKWSGIPMDREDLLQEIDILLYKAYLKYDEKYNKTVSFMTYAYGYININLSSILRDTKRGKKAIDREAIRYNNLINEDGDSLENLICGEESFEEDLITELDLNNFLDKLNFREKRVFEMLHENCTQTNICEEFGCSQATISRTKTKIYRTFQRNFLNIL